MNPRKHLKKAIFYSHSGQDSTLSGNRANDNQDANMTVENVDYRESSTSGQDVDHNELNFSPNLR